jgi:antitoxin component of MazEF toxin-antitoxin module
MKCQIELVEDPETGELVLPLPDAVLDSLGWSIGDTLVWSVKNGQATIHKKENP